MDEAEKEKFLEKLNKINDILQERISMAKIDIKNQKKLIEEDKHQLMSLTEEIIKNVEERAKIEIENERISSDLEKIKSEMESYQGEIDKGLADINVLIDQMNSQKPNDDTLNILNHIFNPVGAIIGDIVFLCKNNIKELEDKINNMAKELGKMSTSFQELENKKNQIDMSLHVVDGNIGYLNDQRSDLENKLKKMGIQKTRNEDFKLNLKLLKSKCQLLIENTKQGKEFLDLGINLVFEIEDELKLIFNKNGLTFNL
ncbi:hypothetical protein ACTA71_010176 [Dictyostelium dimigraforme]